jgi:hypothetical protein
VKNLENLRSCVRIILKCMLKKYCVRVGTELIWLSVENSREQSTEPQSSTNGGEFLHQLSDKYLNKTGSATSKLRARSDTTYKKSVSSASQSRILPERFSSTRSHNTAPGIGLQYRLRPMLVVCSHNNITDYPSDTYIVYN